MTGPLVYIGTHRIKDGQRETALARAREVVELVREHEPQMIAFDFFLSEDGTELTVTQVHPDVASMYTHMQVIAQHLQDYSDYIEVLRTAVYGEDTSALLEDIRKYSAPDVVFDVKPSWVGGATRTAQHTSA